MIDTVEGTSYFGLPQMIFKYFITSNFYVLELSYYYNFRIHIQVESKLQENGIPLEEIEGKSIVFSHPLFGNKSTTSERTGDYFKYLYT